MSDANRSKTLLEPTTATADLLPIRLGDHLLSETHTPLTSVAPLKGQEAAVRQALGHWPAPNHAEGNVLWAGRNQAFVLGKCPKIDGAATTDQTDAWAHLVLEGPGLEDILARLCPLDLQNMTPGLTARSLLGHMNALYWRKSEQVMAIFVFRSTALTAVHEIECAMKRHVARHQLAQRDTSDQDN